ncbi:Chitinase 2, partial [Coemansia sp. RSA 2337]
NQVTLGSYCADATEDVIVLAFMNGFPNIILNFANACETTFEGSSLLHCPNIAADIKFCQSKGKAVILSMGGASGAYGFSSDSQASQFADTMWNMFFKGTAAQRPFDDAVLDGIDLDIEGGGASGYTTFISQLRTHYASDPSRQYYIAAAPQCPFPDAYIGSTLKSAWFDMVFVQFYNNYCGLNAYPTWFNFADWDNWAKTQSLNKNVKVFIGALGSPTAGSTGYVDGPALSKIYTEVRSKYTSLGGIMTWDVSQGRTSGIAKTIRSALDLGGSCSNSTGQPSNTDSSSTTATTQSPNEPTDSTTIPISTTTATVTETVTSVSTLVSTRVSTITVTSPYTSYLTVTVTYTDPSQAISSQIGSSTLAISTSQNRNSLSSKTEKTTSPSASNFPTLSTDSPVSTALDPFPMPDPTASKCPIEGAPCTEYTQGCNGSGYALCMGGRWSIYPCAAGTTCYLYGSSAICDWAGASEGNQCSMRKILQLPAATKPHNSWLAQANTKPISVYTTEGVGARIEFIPLSVSLGRYTALVKIQALAHPFSHNWKLQLRLPWGQTIDHTDRGRIVTNNTLVSIESADPVSQKSSMAISMEIRGRYLLTYRLPDLTTAVMNI